MYSKCSDDVDDSETSPVGLCSLFFLSPPVPIQMKVNGLRTGGSRTERTGKWTWVTKWVLSYQSWAATKHVRAEQQHDEGRPSPRVDQGESWRRERQRRSDGAEVCWQSLTFLSRSLPLARSVWLTRVISTDLHFPCVWLKASCVKAVQIKTARHATLSSTPLHSNSPAPQSALLFLCLPGCLSVARTGKSPCTLFCTKGKRRAD